MVFGRAQVLYHCDVAEWMKFCLEHPDAHPQLRFDALVTTDSRGNVERMYGAPHTSLWQELIEQESFPGGLPDGVDVVGGMHAFDVSDVQRDGSRKSGNFYGAPAGLSTELRGHADVWPPIAHFPYWKHDGSDSGKSRWRALMRECLSIIFACYDGHTYIRWRTPSGEERLGLLALQSLVVDGGDYGWMVNNRGPASLFGCGRCRIPSSLLHQPVTQLSRWHALRRTFSREIADLEHAQSLRLQGDRDRYSMLCGMQPDLVRNPLYDVFGSLTSCDWVIARLLAVEPLHTIDSGVAQAVELLMIQLPQRLHEAMGETSKATSPAARFADSVLKQSARDLHRIVAAVPTQRRHSTWPVSTTTRQITRDRGKLKTPLPLIDFRFANSWHYRDLGRVMAVWVLQPTFLGAGMDGPITNPVRDIDDFFGKWQRRSPLEGGPSGTYVSHSHAVGLTELASLLAEVWCLFVSWYDLFLTVPLSERQLQDLRVLYHEFHESAKRVLGYKATWKTHQMEEAPESRRDLGNQITANLSESAHKLPRLLFRLASNRSLTDFTAQLMQARNRVVAAQLLRRLYEGSLKPSADNAPSAKDDLSPSRQTHLGQPQQKWTLELTVDDRHCVTSLASSCGMAQQNQAMLLEEQGFQHLFWAILSYLSNGSAIESLEQDGRHWPLSTLGVHPSIMIGQTGCPKASAAIKIPLEPFTQNPTHAFVRVDAGGGVEWFGRAVLGASVTTGCGDNYQLVYCKWLDYALTGIERLKLPLPTTFPLHQWAKTYMGLPPAGHVRGHAWYATDSYGMVDAAKVMNWEPIVSIGLRVWRPTPTYRRALGPRGQGVDRGRGRGRGGSRYSEPEPEGVGEPLFANNVHVWSFGSGK